MIGFSFTTSSDINNQQVDKNKNGVSSAVHGVDMDNWLTLRSSPSQEYPNNNDSAPYGGGELRSRSLAGSLSHLFSPLQTATRTEHPRLPRPPTPLGQLPTASSRVSVTTRWMVGPGIAMATGMATAGVTSEASTGTGRGTERECFSYASRATRTAC
jgi:hypothetical protein